MSSNQDVQDKQPQHIIKVLLDVDGTPNKISLDKKNEISGSDEFSARDLFEVRRNNPT